MNLLKNLLIVMKSDHTHRIWGFVASMKSFMIMLEFLKLRMLINQLRCLSKVEFQALGVAICDWIRPDED